jgi:enoyl-CoA hydratase/3-hydroxyacyl-CoA dehydrogenase
MAFPETGIGIYPGLGGMLRIARHAGPELAKYFVITGATISIADARALGIVTRVIEPAEIDTAIKAQISEGKPDKYRDRELPERFKPLALIGAPENVERLLAGKPPEGVDEALASKTAKFVGYKAPLALDLVSEIVDQQMGKSMEEAVDIELGRLEEIFSTADALEGLSSLGRKRPEYKGV